MSPLPKAWLQTMPTTSTQILTEFYLHASLSRPADLDLSENTTVTTAQLLDALVAVLVLRWNKNSLFLLMRVEEFIRKHICSCHFV